jgi:phosphomannomutase
MSVVKDTRTVVLFDVDGTLTKPRNVVTQQVLQVLRALLRVVSVGIIGGSRVGLIEEQLGPDILREVDFVFAENGLCAFQKGNNFASTSLLDALGETQLQEFINCCLHYIADLKIPQKRGTFIEFRTGMLNISPIGRNCSQAERDAFEAYDREHEVRKRMIEHLRKRFEHLNLVYSIGGQISFDVMPVGWTKEYALRYLPESEYARVVFIGDKCYQGGNDWEIYSHSRVEGYAVSGPDETTVLLRKLFPQIEELLNESLPAP